MEWETLHDDTTNATFRAKVPGGWLYKVIYAIPGASVGVALAFVPAETIEQEMRREAERRMIHELAA